MNKKIIYILSHPIQYYSPLFKEMTRQGLALEVLYCSDETVNGYRDLQFGVEVKWDIDLFADYKFEFVRNNSLTPSIYNGFFGLINLGILKRLRKSEQALIIIPGWSYFSYILALIAAKIYGHQVALRTESPLNQELMKSKWKLFFRKYFFKYGFFKLVDFFLYIGIQNKNFYKYYGVNEKKLLFTPYCVNNDHFASYRITNELVRQTILKKLGLQPQLFTIVASGKYIQKKRHLDLLIAFRALNNNHAQLVLVGDGEKRILMEQYIKQHGLSNVHLTGFVNQNVIVDYYAVADVFVLCSGVGETWGLTVNEAMNTAVPAIISDMSGCCADLVKENMNGYVFPVGDVHALTLSLQKIINKTPEERAKMGELSSTIISQYSFKTVIEGYKNICNTPQNSDHGLS